MHSHLLTAISGYAIFVHSANETVPLVLWTRHQPPALNEEKS
ncbi:hypothetical protein PA05_0968 [Cutibacterium acnes P05]|nr:hypothetical protein [Cutibacterium acnes P05]